MGFKPWDNMIASIYSRVDEHKTTGKHNVHKLNITQFVKKFKLGATYSTGLRNPSLYELYGTDSSGYSGNQNLKPEKAKTNELFAEYEISKNFLVSLTGFKTSIYDLSLIHI